jgi:hypothetical protein
MHLGYGAIDAVEYQRIGMKNKTILKMAVNPGNPRATGGI